MRLIIAMVIIGIGIAIAIAITHLHTASVPSWESAPMTMCKALVKVPSCR